MSFFSTFIKLTAKGLILIGVGVFGYQAIMGFLHGHWMELDLLWLVYRVFSSPEGLGLGGAMLWFLDFLPLSLSLVVIGLFLLASVYRGEKERSRVIDEVEREMRARRDQQAP